MAKKKEQTKKTNQKRKREEVETKSKKVKENDKKDTNFENLSSSLNSIAESQTSATTDEDFRTLLNEEYLEETATIPLIRKLRKVYTALSKITQEEFNSKLWDKNFPNLFVSKKFINHKDKEVKLLTSCILCEIFRITVPEHPFGDDDVKKIFKLLVSQLKGLEDNENPLFPTYFRLLEKVSSIRIFVLLTDPDIDGNSIIEEIFALFFEIVNSKHEQKVSVYMIDIMVSLIESCESISTSLLESILEPLLLKEMQSSYHLSKVLLSRTVDYIVSNLNEYIVGELNNLDKEKPKFKVKRSHIFNIIIQLNDISSKFLLYIMPTIAFQLKDEDVEIRSAIILLLSRMFSSKESTLIQDYNEIFGEFLARFNDIDSTIRIHMVKSMIDLVKNHPNYTMEKVNKYLGERIMDVDEKVRRNVVETVCQIATFSHSYVTNDLMIQVGERMRDKKDQLRSHTTTLLSQLYRSYYNVIQQDEEIEKKFGWIPEKIMCNSSNDQIDQLLNEELLPKNQDRVKAFLYFYSCLQESGKTCFKRYLTFKQKYTDSLREQFRSSSQQEESKIWKSLSKDQFNKIKRILEEEELTFEELNKMELSKIYEKNEELKTVILRCTPLLTVDQMKETFEWIEKDFSSISPLLSCFSEILPTYYFKDSIKKIISFLDMEDDFILISLEILNNIGKQDDEYSNQILKKLKNLVASKKEKIVKYSVRAANKILKKESFEKFISKIYDDLILDLDFNQDLIFSLIVFREVAILAPSIFKKKAAILTHFIMNDLILNSELNTESKSLQNVSYECQVKCKGIKVLVGYLFCLEKEGISYSSEETKKKMIEFLFDLLRKLSPFCKTTLQEEEEEEKSTTPISDSRLLLKISNGILEISTIPEYHKTLIGRREYLDLSYISLNEKIGKLFLEKLFEKLKKMKLPLKYTSILLLGIGTNHGDSTIKNSIEIILNSYRQYNEMKKISLSAETSFKTCPEYIFPSLIYLLAHHPMYEEEKENFNQFQKILFAYFDQVTLNVDNLSFFQQLISKLKQRRDVDLENDSFRIQELCDLSLSILNRSTEGKSHASQVYPGKIYIPPYYKLAEGFKVTQLFLSPNVKISEKNARKVTSSTPEKKQSTPTKSPKKKAATPKKTPKKAATPKKKTPKKESKKKESVVESRTKLKRGAKKVETYQEGEESEDKMEEEEEEKESAESEASEPEEEEIQEPKSTMTRKRKNKI